MNKRNSYDWEQISIDAVDALGDDSITNIAKLSVVLGIPYTTLYDAIQRGDVQIPAFVTDDVRTVLPVTGLDEIGMRLAQLGFMPNEWKIQTANLDLKNDVSRILLRRQEQGLLKVSYREWPEVNSMKRTINEYWRRAMVIPDLHFGFVGDEPIHDEKVLEILLDVASDDWDEIVILGDCLDMEEWSRFLNTPESVYKTQEAISRLNDFLFQLRSVSPHSLITILEGNHDKRFRDTIAKKLDKLLTLELVGGTNPSDLTNYLSLEELNIDWIGNYPNSYYQFSHDVIIVHGDVAKSGMGQTAEKMWRFDCNVVFGHIHRQELIVKPGIGRKHFWSASPGCACRIDGVVPGSKVDNDWTQGWAEVKSFLSDDPSQINLHIIHK